VGLDPQFSTLGLPTPKAGYRAPETDDRMGNRSDLTLALKKP